MGRPSVKSGLRKCLRAAIVCSSWALIVFGIPRIALSGQYDIVRGEQYKLCRELLENFNESRNDPPMVCRRKFAPGKDSFHVPPWKQLDPEANWPLIMSARRAFDARRRLSQELLQKSLADYKNRIEQQIRADQFRLYEADIDLAHSGQKVRVLLMEHSCDPNNLYQDGTGPSLAVVHPGTLQPDPRFSRFQGYRADVFLFEGRPYLANWSFVPSATGREPGPAKEHDGYVLVYEPFWLRMTDGITVNESAGFKGPVCQIGYKR